MLLSQRPLTPAKADVRLAVPSRVALAERMARNVLRERNTLILGSRGSGRTSTLALVEASLRAGPESQVARVDAGPWTETADLVGAILALLGDDRRGPTTRTVGWQDRWNVRGGFEDVGVVDQRVFNETDAARIVRAARQVVEQSDQSRVVVLVDNLRPGPGHDLFGRFRDTLWEAPITWVAAGDGDQDGYLKPPADVFWERVEWLEPLDQTEAQDVLVRRIDTAGDDDRDASVIGEHLDEILAVLDHPQPRDVIRAAADVADAGTVEPVESSQARLEAAHRAGGRRAAMLLAELDALGRPAHAGDDELLARMGLTRPRLVQLLGALTDADLITKHREGRRVLFEPKP